ncbi:MAG: adenosine deaminase [Anaerolineae bacterium]|nr:adenosine deaminase [Anaerolineae bacterium]
MNNTSSIQTYEILPKLELHLHLEGAIPLDALWALVQKYGGHSDVPDLDALRRRFTYRDFPHFIETWVWKNQFLREYEDFTFIAEAVARNLARQNIIYVEAFYSPADFSSQGLEVQGITQAIRKGLARVPEVEVVLVIDLIRDLGPERAAITLAQVYEVRDQGVTGIGIGGSEQAFPPEPFAEVYERARTLGFHTAAHAGEAAGAESIWGAIRALHVERIGHGTRAEEDPALLDYLAEHQIPLEMCPLSNVCTGVVPSLDVHPIRRYFERGLPVTVNSDDPKMFGNSLAEEYYLLETRLGFTREDIRTLIGNAVRASWLPEDRKTKMSETLKIKR